MTHDEACALIGGAVARGEAWAELGAGRGTFTRALGELVGGGGGVWASDRNPAAVRALRSLELPGGARLEVAGVDFTRADDSLACRNGRDAGDPGGHPAGRWEAQRSGCGSLELEAP